MTTTDKKLTLPENWKRVELGDISDITNGKANTQDAVAGGEYPLFDRSVSIKSSDKYLFDKTAVILPGEGAEFVPRYYSGKFDLHQRVYAIFPSDEVYPPYLFQYLYANRAFFAQNAVGSTVKSLRLPIIQKVPVLLPPHKEQEKIAEILSTVDEEIQRTDEVISATDKLKTGLLRQLFDLKGETSKLNEISTLITKGTTPTTYGHVFTDEGINFFKIENIDESGNINLSSCKHISSDTHQFLKRSQLMPGDVLFSIAGALGRIAVINESHVPANINQAIAIIRLKDTSDAKFVSQVLKTDYVMRQVVGSSVQLAQANISLGKLGDITLPWPSKKERERISNVIQSIDEKVTVNKKVKGQLSLLKKGLMQDLLTGKKRTI